MDEIGLNENFFSLQPESSNFFFFLSNQGLKIKNIKFEIKIEFHKFLGTESL
jgi:hypothetical protein